LTTAPNRETPITAHPLILRLAGTTEELAAVYALRREVFAHEQGMPDGGAVDQSDTHSLHLMALRGTCLVATGRLTLDWGPLSQAQIAWVATLASARHQGIGTALVRNLLALAAEANAPAVLLSAQVHAQSFYAALGFTPYGEPFSVHGIVHQHMAWTPEL